MSATYRSRATQDQRIADDYLANNMPCSFCGCSTDRETLVEYGARCGACFTQYVTGGRPNPPMLTKAQKVAALIRMKAVVSCNSGSKQWAETLRSRERSGESLSLAQRQALREVLLSQRAEESAWA